MILFCFVLLDKEAILIPGCKISTDNRKNDNNLALKDNTSSR